MTASIFQTFMQEAIQQYEDHTAINNLLQNTIIDNTNTINNYLTQHPCNIINYMPMELMRNIVNGYYNAEDLKYPLYVFFNTHLYCVKELDPRIISDLNTNITYATTIKKVSKDYLEAYISHSYGGL